MTAASNSEARKRLIEAQQRAECPLSHPIPAPVDSGAIGQLNDDEADRVLEAVWSWEEADEGVMAEEVVLPVVDAIVREHTDRALAEERDRWIARLAHLCDDVWLRNRDRAMDLPDSKTYGWMRRGSSVWEQAARSVRSVLNDLADYDDEYVERHASYMTWLRNGRDRDELRAARQEQGR